ncbi:hypothetical protein K437DRAFT_255819 [Tilletiaria anomala UBC 951]|uniref:Uncharacterized protein n=1 Tax=Tilletiaria anomala (strain ATCC 24038 / CBS 436.72 / UBC 951) TaxID=1037660 RepID=A0A066W9T2_TILAU|nr:uncharacterized protein K437DRAFT_255819 [Tilletiaria anomala UBC 951]KDN47540.1 hypothetical protein K437DRAFT_255819 [Tilletiaria anomala UBC 951]
MGLSFRGEPPGGTKAERRNHFLTPKDQLRASHSPALCTLSRQVFDKPAPSFARQAPTRRSPINFLPMALRASGKHVADRFELLYPGVFLAHLDVSLADWARFLENLSVAGRLNALQRVVNNVVPITMHMGATGFLITRAIEGEMKTRKVRAMMEALEIWMVQFFAAR